MVKILVKVTDGKKIYIENMTDKLDINNNYWYREIKINETYIDKYRDHFIFDWWEDLCKSDLIPDWILKSQILNFEVIHQY